MAGLDAFKGVTTANDAQKGALVSLIGQMGSAGAEAYKADQAVAQQAAKAGAAGVVASNPGIGQPNMASAVGPGELTAQLAARAAEPGMTAARGAGEASSEFNRYAGLLGTANSNYANAVSQAAPIVESQTRSQVAKIMADLQAERESRQYEADQRAIAAREHAEDRAFELKKRGWLEKDRLAELGLAGGPKPRAVEEVGKAMGLSDEQTGKAAADPMYGVLSEAAASLIERFPDMTYAQLAGHLQGAAKENAGDYPGTHIGALSLVLGQMAPLVGGNGGQSSLDIGYHAYGKQSGRERKAAEDKAKAKANAAERKRQQQLAAAQRAAMREAMNEHPYEGYDAGTSFKFFPGASK